MKFLGVIPARYGSSRLEGKPLKNINGSPMIEWVYKRAVRSKLDTVIVATDDKRIYDEVKKFGGNVMMTSKDHLNGTSRIAEVLRKNLDYDVVINVQGDEPLIDAKIINKIVDKFNEENNLNVVTLKHKIESENEIKDPNNVKVITDKEDNGIYFSRSVIPFSKMISEIDYYKHIGIYGYKTKFVFDYIDMEPTLLEKIESLEQLRILENGYKIKVLETNSKIMGVDTAKDLEDVIDYINKNNIEL